MAPPGMVGQEITVVFVAIVIYELYNHKVGLTVSVRRQGIVVLCAL